ncbi:MAG: RNA 2',3'-cyclic phosphodiesterase [Pirellulaceae bacterium]|jgi:2'-5' RNA ligase|nr:RNA 2',3'-cyclic phosphodiesterase [Pirellulaceae bacterium]MCU0980821.1 RNA 2',3'-cyclic phosphodiesterase [Pirellulaceae bacterium]
MSKKIRTFIAVELSAAVRAEAVRLVELLRPAGGDAKWVEPQNMHLTLKFLGDVREEAIADVCRVVTKAAVDFPPFDIKLSGAGAFPDLRRPRTLWIGVTQGQQELVRLQTAIERALAKRGFPKENRDFFPHLTIGRIRESGPQMGELGQLIHIHADFAAGGSTVREVVVFASHLSSSGPAYEALARAALGAAP